MRFKLSLGFLCLAATLGAASAAQEDSRPPGTIVLHDGQRAYSRGSYLAYASPWSTVFDKELRHGPDYFDTITIRPSSFPNDTLFSTRWPERPPRHSGVWGYHALSFGNYEGTQPRVPVPPRRVAEIRALVQEFEYSFSGSANFNLLNEFYLTSRPGKAADKVIEIGFLLHVPPSTMNYFDRAVPIGRYVDSGAREWRVARSGSYCMFVPADGGAILNGRIDVKAALDFLIAHHVISGREWFNGIAFGTEPTIGGGTTQLRIARWHVSYE